MNRQRAVVAPLLILTLALLGSHRVESEEAPRMRDIFVTLQSDGERCTVRNVTIFCSDLETYLRDTLKLPYETVVRLRAGRSTSYQAVRRVLDLIEQSGFRHPARSVPKGS